LVAGASWETFVLEEIQRRTHLEDPFASFFFWRTSDGHEADLLIERGGKPDTLVEVKTGGGASSRAAVKLAAIAKQLGARRACIVSQQNGVEMLNPTVERIGPDALFAREW
jgi:predicted AAA+ superfamily ATPase